MRNNMNYTSALRVLSEYAKQSVCTREKYTSDQGISEYIKINVCTESDAYLIG